ncbi:MAG: threonine-phosphate decarboxylase CobD [Leptolyngbya sp.]|nr:threonine-phosphate decarboxylase CobD [Leptolyngbya sp.]
MEPRPVHGGNLAWAAEIAGCSPSGLVDFSASINPLGPPESVQRALQAALATLGHYPDPAYTDLRSALGLHHHLPADWVLPGNGAAELITWAARDLASLDPPTLYLPTPAFNDYQRACRSFGVTIAPWPLWPPTPGPDAPAALSPPVPTLPIPTPPIPTIDLRVRDLVATAPPKAGVLINNPHNPTGHLFGLEDLRPLLDHFRLVVVDEAFMDFLPPTAAPSLAPWVEHYPNLVVLRSLTKFYSLPGLRLGYALGHPDRLHRWQRWRDPWPVNTLAAAAALAAVADQIFQAQTWAWLPPTRQALRDNLAALGGFSPLPSAANYLLVRAAGSVTDLQHTLLRQSQVLIRDCLSFAELGDHYFRVAVRSEAENDYLLTALTAAQGV